MSEIELPLAVTKLRKMNAEMESLTAKLKAAEEALEGALNIAEQNVEDPDIVLIEHVKEALEAIRSGK